MFKKLFFISFIITIGLHAESCFNATEVSKAAPSPFASAPLLEKAIIKHADELGWSVDKESANTAAYFVIGKIGAVMNDTVKVCLLLNNAGDLSFKTFPSKSNSEEIEFTGFMPLNAKKK
jgi:hypothetical protein